ncbi:MAG TPA: polysaccharide lyase family protein [Armatimonadota bacterium]
MAITLHARARRWAATGVAALGVIGAACAGGPLWTIGAEDRSTREFALAPGDYARFADDGDFAVGRSNPARDWPCIQPGPDDGWAGSRPHVFTIAFGVASLPKTGSCTLTIWLADTHSTAPPGLRIAVNGHAFDRATPAGSGDGSLEDPARGRPARIAVGFPARDLRIGGNEITVTTLRGSWMLYDAIRLDAPGVRSAPSPSTRVTGAHADQALLRSPSGPVQPITMDVRRYGAPTPARLRLGGISQSVMLKDGLTRVRLSVPPAKKAKVVPARLEMPNGHVEWSGSVSLKPVRPWTLYLLPHSHVDIGYTAQQSDVLIKQCANLEAAIDLARKSAGYPAGARFKWNAEVLWAVDAYLKQATPEQRRAMVDAVSRGWLEMDALYGNELTALCRPEELVRLVGVSARIARETGRPIDTAMISDVPGYTWGIIPVLADAGVRYFSFGPNQGDRIGFTAKPWADKPFYWLSPAGDTKVLCWMAGTAYSWFHSQTLAQKGAAPILDYLGRLDREGYPYDMVQVRYTVNGDNGPPDVTLSDTVKAWNERYASPRIVVATTSEMFRAFEAQYAKKIPSFRGDFTPYWEDGAASSARETALNRASAERLSQAETLWAMRRPAAAYPASDVEDAWRNVILYDEHTWGAYNSISEPDSPFVKGQWAVKQAFALDADRQSRRLLDAGLAPVGVPATDSVDVFNTSSWDRSDLVTLPAAMSRAGDRVLDAGGEPAPSQRLASGELAFLARNVPAFGAIRYRVTAGNPPAGEARAVGSTLHAAGIDVDLDPATGNISRLSLAGDNLAGKLNDYIYVPGRDPKDAVTSGAPTIAVIDSGPLVAAIEVRSEAPGADGLVRVIRVVDGLRRVDIANTLDKRAVRAKEGVHFGFAFNVPRGVVRLDTPWAVVRPETDQLPGACKNWFTVQRWVDVSGASSGVTLATPDAPLVEVGGITAELPSIAHLAPTQTILSYVMNNYWHTNYKADQSGPTTFRYALWPHGPFDALATAQFGMGVSRPLLVAPAAGPKPNPFALRLDPPSAVVESLYPSEDGKGWMIRLFGASGRPAGVRLRWPDAKDHSVYRSDPSEQRGARVHGEAPAPAWGLVTLRAQM